MEVKIVEIGDDYVRLIVKGEEHTYLNLLQHYLVEDDDVIIARYNIPHPLVGEPELYVRTNGKNPLEVIKKANEKIIEACNTLADQI
ncbi:RpoL/Rpb11 RNA polymerase subunit family protein [Archaeoglobus neptunius]|uniref:RpoL/Rpb11 RNA polymerase subunit family protein n=1 Tax=Archaeoglobus neptunius TaxID=2798580 RepID=UPI001925F587|nr:DNA-directed RNA polymerase subunit L [Archaeoglobus neptunius]